MNKERPVRTVLFDFDGTLADTAELILRSYRHTMTAHLGSCPPDDEWLRGFGTPLDLQLARFARSTQESAAMLDTYRAYQEQHYDATLRPFPGAVETVNELVERRVRLAIVTSRFRKGTLRGMELCGLLDHVSVLVTPEDVTHAKPHPEPVLRALECLGAQADESLFVGDSPHDMAAGRAAGVRTGAALWGPFPRAALEVERPDAFLERIDEVVALIGNGGSNGHQCESVQPSGGRTEEKESDC